MKLTTFFVSSTRCIFTKLLAEPESSTNIRVRSNSTFFVILLQQLFVNKDFCMKTRLCSIFKTANVIMLTKTILESPYELLQDS